MKAGDPLFDIDRANYELAVEQVRKRARVARHRLSQAGRSGAAEAVVAHGARKRRTRAHWARNQELMKSGFLSAQGGETARTASRPRKPR